MLTVRGVHELLAISGFAARFAHQSVRSFSTDVFAVVPKGAFDSWSAVGTFAVRMDDFDFLAQHSILLLPRTWTSAFPGQITCVGHGQHSSHDVECEVLTIFLNENVFHFVSFMKNFAAAFKRPKPEGAGLGSRQSHALDAELRSLARDL